MVLVRDSYELERRRRLLRTLRIDVANKEWLYMLGTETRHSVAIEGVFSSEKELKAIIDRSDSSEKMDYRVLNYFRTAQFLYDLALQHRESNEPRPYLVLIKTLHSRICSGLNLTHPIGDFRKGPISITNSLIQPPFDPRPWMVLWTHYVDHALSRLSIDAAMARIHSLFEAIHPFYDGNGRVGRLIMNFILVAEGYSNIVIKGVEKEDREIYYRALEEGDYGISKLLENGKTPLLETAIDVIEDGSFSRLQYLIHQAIIESSNRLLTIYEREDSLLTVQEVSRILGISETAVKKRITSGRIIASKVDKGTWRIPSKYL